MHLEEVTPPRVDIFREAILEVLELELASADKLSPPGDIAAISAIIYPVVPGTCRGGGF